MGAPLQKFHLNASTVIWMHKTQPDKRPNKTWKNGIYTLETCDSCKIKDEMQILADYFSLNTNNSFGNCLSMLERSLGLRDADPIGGDNADDATSKWALEEMRGYANEHGIVFDVGGSWGSAVPIESAAPIEGFKEYKGTEPFHSWWMGYFDNPTVMDPDMDPEQLLHAVESCLQVRIIGRPEIAGVAISHLYKGGGPKWTYRHRRATHLINDKRAFEWACSLGSEKCKKDIFTNDPLARYLFDKKRKTAGMKPFFPDLKEDDLEIVLKHGVAMPKNLKIQRLTRRYTGPDDGYSTGRLKPHPFTIGAQHFTDHGTIDYTAPCDRCHRPSEDHTYEIAALIAISGSANESDIVAAAKAVEERAKEVGFEVAGIGLLDAKTGKGADVETQILKGV